ncbi:MAG: methionine--tRNA ligase [Bryobacterales bacterium]
MSKYYLTTPIYYVNASPHIGHAYTTLTADTIKRFRRMMGDEAFLTTGTDEHGQKVEQSAKAAGWTPQEFTDRVSDAFRREWDELGIDYDFFRRTTDPKHAKAVHEIFLRCQESGAIYKDSYTGKYSVTDEMFVTEEEAAELDPEKVVELTEENYFFKLSAFEDKLLDLYERQPDFIEPESRRNEVLAFVKEGLKDLSISRSTLKWGIPLPNDPAHVFYVWFDALTTYMSAIGYGEEGEPRKTWERLWPANVHLVGKEILRFHAVYWPAFLMAAGLPLPKKIYAHGWLVFQGDKMSKSKGNIVRALPIQKVVGVEGLRYYLLREIVFGQDGNFSWEALVGRYNSDLANGIGNLLSRTVTMIHKYRDGKVPAPPAGHDAGLPEKARQTIPAAIDHYERFEFSKALESIWSLLGAVDKYIVEMKPWTLAKGGEEDQAKLDATLYNSAEVLRIACALAYPVLPTSTPKIWTTLGQLGALDDYKLENLAWGELAAGTTLGEPEALYPRLDVEKAVKEMQELEEEALKEQAAIMGKTAEAAPAEEPKKTIVVDTPEIEIDDFFKVDMRVGLVVEARKHPDADKLLHLTIDIGEAEPRSICAGIAGVYEPEKLVGRKVAIAANLKGRKMRGIMSQGMIIAASGDDRHPYLVSFLENAPVGARLG